MVEIAVTGPYFYTTPRRIPKLRERRARSRLEGLCGLSFGAMGLTPLDFFVKARFEPVAAVVLLLTGGWYVWSLRRLARKGRSWPAGRTACFAAAWVLLVVSVFSGLAAFGPTNFTAYGAGYITVGLVVPALLAFAAPLTLALQSASRPDRAGALESRPLRVLAHPMTTWIQFSATLFVVFFSGLVGQTVSDGGAREAVYLWLVVSGWLFFWPVVDVDPRARRMAYWPRILYLLLSFPVFAVLGMGLESQSQRIAPGISPASLHLGGAVIWVAGETVALTGAIWVFAQWLRTDERRAKSQELANEDAASRQLALWRESRRAAARAASK